MVQHVRTTAFGSLVERTAAYAYIEKEIAVLEVSLCSWKQEYNKLSLISRLSPELLSPIFVMVQEDLGDDMSWIPRVSHICSYWRSVALECGSLWTKLPLWSASWTNEMLLRSKMAPLKIDTSASNFRRFSPPNLSPETAIANLHRIKSLHIHHGWEGFESLLARLNSCTPLLEYLAIDDVGDHALPPRALEHAPSLRHLSVTDCGFHFSILENPSYDNFRSLSICTAGVPPLHSVTQVLSVLCRMSKLEQLELKLDFIPSIDAELYRKSSMIASFPNLKSLGLECDAPHCVVLLDHIHFSNAASIVLIPRIVNNDTEEHTSLHLHRLLDILSRKISGRISSLDVWNELIRLEVDHNLMDTDYPKQSITIKLPGREALDEDDFPFFLSIIQPLPLQHLKSLMVIGPDLPGEQHIWPTLFAQLPSLEKICLSFSRCFLDALLCESGSFHALKHLVLSFWTFEDYETRIMDDFIEHLRTRRQQNLQLHRLEFAECVNIHLLFVEKLQEVVTYVQVDGEYY